MQRRRVRSHRFQIGKDEATRTKNSNFQDFQQQESGFGNPNTTNLQPPPLWWDQPPMPPVPRGVLWAGGLRTSLETDAAPAAGNFAREADVGKSLSTMKNPCRWSWRMKAFMQPMLRTCRGPVLPSTSVLKKASSITMEFSSSPHQMD